MRHLQWLRSIRAWLALTGVILAIGGAGMRTCHAADFDVYDLSHVAPDDAKRIILTLTRDRPGDLQIVVDEQSKTLLIRGSEELRAFAGEVVEQIDQPAVQSNSSGIDRRPTEASPAARPNPFDPIPPPRRPPAANSLQQILERRTADRAPLTEQPPTGSRGQRGGGEISNVDDSAVTYVYALKTTTPIQVVQVLESVFGTGLQPVGSREFVIETQERSRLDLRFEQRSASLLMTGPAPLVQQFGVLLDNIDHRETDPGKTSTLLPIRRADPAVIERVVHIWDVSATSTPVSRADAAFGPGVGRRIRPAGFQDPAAATTPDAPTDPQDGSDDAPLRRPSSEVEVQSLPDLDVIILRGLGADVDELSRIINEIERLSAETTPQIEVYPLQHVRGEALQRLVTQVLESLTSTLQGRVSMTPLVKPNAVLLVGWGTAVEAVKQLIAELDQPADPSIQLRVFRLKHAPAQQAQTTIQQFYANRGGLGPDIDISADLRTNSLIVSASPRDLEELQLLIRQLDVGEAEAVNQGRVIRLKNSLANDIANTLNAAIDAAGGGGTGPNAGRSAILEMLLVDPEGRRVVTSGLLNDVRITPDPRMNSLIVTGPEQSMDLIEALIRELDETPASSAQIKVFQVVNGDATEMVLMLRSLFPAQPGASSVPQLPSAEDETSLVPVRFSVDSRTNSIIATGAAGDLRIIEALLARLDAEEAQQRINRVYRLRNSPAVDVAVAINDFLRNERLVQRAAPGRPSPFQQIETEVVVVAEPVGNALIISASPRYYEEIIELVEDLDEQPPQVLVQVIIAEVDLSQFHEFGVELGLQDSVLFDRSLLGDIFTTTSTLSQSTPAGIVTSTNELIQAATLAPGFDFNNNPLGNSGSDKSLGTSGDVGGQGLSHFNLGRTNSELGYGGLVLSASSENVSLLIRALDQSRHAEILSRPQIMTLDNQPAFIQVGQRVPRIVASSINTIGQVNTVELEDVGLILGIRPRISPDGMVVLDLDAEKSQVGPESEGIPVSVSAEGEVVRSPRVDITRAQTTVSAASGQTIVLGGLITKDHMATARKVPWLGDIPLIGPFFRYDSNSNDRRELLIILTPHVIRGPADVDYHKQIEMARMSWCTADVYDFLTPSRPVPILSGQQNDDGVPVIYPDQTPGLEWQREQPPQAPPGETGSSPYAPGHSVPTRPLPRRGGRAPDALPLNPPDPGAEPQGALDAEPDDDGTSPVQQAGYERRRDEFVRQTSRNAQESPKPMTKRWWSLRSVREGGSAR